jgi:aminopeptidase C
MSNLSDSIYRLSELLSKMDVQLDIHQHEMMRILERYMMLESDLLSEKIEAQTAKEWKQVLTEARRNYKIIKSATSNFRNFLAKEFSFKESF